MSQQQRIKIPRQPDRKIVEVFRDLGARHGISQAHVAALGFDNIGSVSLSDEPANAFKVLLDHDSELIDTMSLSISALTLVYSRGGQYGADQKSPVYDEIVLTWNGQQASNVSDSQKLDILALINSALNPFHEGRGVDGPLTKEQQQLLAIHTSTLERLEQLNENLVRQSSEMWRRLDERVDSKLKEYEGNYTAKKQQLEADHQARATALDEREKSIEEKLKEIDDRDNTHARREIRNRMLDDVKERIKQFGVSAATRSKRKPVAMGMLLLVLALMWLLAWTIGAIDKVDVVAPANHTELYFLWIRFTFFTFSLLGTLLYYIKWQDKWAQEHASSEFQLQQFYIDVNRANWAIESCLEWKKETNSEIPKELLASVTHGLFVNKELEPERVIHPADELASALLGSASNLKLKVGDSEIAFDKPNKIGK